MTKATRMHLPHELADSELGQLADAYHQIASSDDPFNLTQLVDCVQGIVLQHRSRAVREDLAITSDELRQRLRQTEAELAAARASLRSLLDSTPTPRRARAL